MVLIGKSSILTLTLLLAFGQSGQALQVNGNKTVDSNTLSYGSGAWQTQMNADGLQALYLFNETGTTFNDTSGVGTPLNLVIDAAGSSNDIERLGGAIRFKVPSLTRTSYKNYQCLQNL